MSEAELERKVVAWAKANGVLTYKFSSPSQRGVPDRIFIGKGGVLFLELKAPGKEPTALQLREIKRINESSSHNVCAAWTGDFDVAVRMIRNVSLE